MSWGGQPNLNTHENYPEWRSPVRCTVRPGPAETQNEVFFSFCLYFSILINRKYLKKKCKRNFKPKCNSFQEIVWFRWTIFFSWILTFDFFANNSVKNTDKGLISILNNLCVTQHYMVANHNILSLLNIYWKYLEPRHLLAMKKKIVIMGGLLSGSFQFA